MNGPNQKLWMAYAGMICGYFSIACVILTLYERFVLFGIIFCIVTGIGGIVFGAMAQKTKYVKMSVLGLCCGIAGILLVIVAIVTMWKTVLILLGLA